VFSSVEGILLKFYLISSELLQNPALDPANNGLFSGAALSYNIFFHEGVFIINEQSHYIKI